MRINSLLNDMEVLCRINSSSFRHACSRNPSTSQHVKPLDSGSKTCRNDGLFFSFYIFLYRAKFSIRIAVLFSFLLASSISSAASDQQTTLQTLLAENRLTISQRLTPENPVQGQEVILEIEISTDRWFAGGTRLKPTLTDDVLVMQRQDLAANSSKQKQGETWVVQLWELSLFPQLEGTLFSPAIDVSLKINTEAGIVEGTYQLEPLLMHVSVPAEVTGTGNWLAVKNFSITSSFNKPLDNLQPGDAFTQTIEFRADNTLAMMLPETITPTVDGLGIYPQPPRLRNNNNRGAREAIRTETVNFVVEKPGNYELHSQTFTWWDTDSNSLREELLDATSFSIGGTASPVSNRQPINYFALIPKQWRWAIGVVILLTLILAYKFWSKQQIKPSSSIPSARKLQQYIMQAINNNDWKAALRWTYIWLDHYSTQTTTLPMRQYLTSIKESSSAITKDQGELEKLFENAFSNKDKRSSNFSLAMFRQSRQNKPKISDDPLRINP